MFKAAYSEIVHDSPSEARAREREAIQRSIDLMKNAETAGVQSREAIVALNFLSSLWTILIEDLASPDNLLPPELRARIISVGLSLMRQGEEIRSGAQMTFEHLIEVSELIKEGLK